MSYVTGPSDASTGVVVLYDIFGMAIQTLQGADLLAARLNSLVLIPDFFEGESANPEWIPADTEEKRSALRRFVSNEASIPRNVDTLLEITKQYNTLFPSVAKWAALGLCWGGKVAVLTSGPGTPFVATGQVHPGRADKTDAEKLTIPHIVLASKDEPPEEIRGYAEVISKNGVGGHVETYNTMWHGWMGARANLDREESNAEYRRGYNQVADFFEKYLKAGCNVTAVCRSNYEAVKQNGFTITSERLGNVTYRPDHIIRTLTECPPDTIYDYLIVATVFDDIQVARWSKLLVNASWNPISALSLCTDGGFLRSSEFAYELVWGIMMEIVALAREIGIPGVDEAATEKRFALSKTRADTGVGHEPSMLQDVKQGRLFEVEAIVGNTVRVGRKWGVPMPRLETVYALAKGRYEALVKDWE
ncbi:ketopantoate reductase PanE/ApbA C terminal-domain-containing protein [Aspergillus coremiiformis]|uniref:Ketopantoate reductase PanE/ApbA C terminal-domain-containing protein n=1 Tax=Aspergillus coremiiformis TaxID=138285 RepID=A0A5N6YXI6_9EURO|nr:ketopantoate reductase PanE/ApbA C terminal-domain-containing protein [Aspergillus coremiiformis]